MRVVVALGCLLGVLAHGLSRWDYEQLKCDIKGFLDDTQNEDGPLLVRLAWHCSGTYNKADGTGGCNGARIRFAPENTDPENNGLKLAMDMLEPFMTGPYDGLTYSDLYTLAGAVAVENMGAMVIPWRPGRKDATDGSTSPQHGRLPKGEGDASHIRDVFTRIGFNANETVALIGAHTLGCAHIENSGYDGCWVDNDTKFTNGFFRWLGERRYEEYTVPESGKKQFVQRRDPRFFMLPADMALLSDPEYKKLVDLYAGSNFIFQQAFSEAFSKLLELGANLSGGYMMRPLRHMCGA